MREAAAWRDVSSRAKIRMTGEDRKRLLHAMCTNHIEELEPGQGHYAFFLNAQGRILADFHVLCMDGSLLLDAEPELAGTIYQHLDQYIIADDVTLTDEAGSTATLAIEGPKAEEVLTSLGAEAPAAAEAWTQWGDVVIAKIDLTGAGGFLLITAKDQAEALKSKLKKGGVPEANAAEARIVRLEHAKPRYGEEITDKYLVQETGQMQAMHFTKGCYLGQEIVERVRSRGQVHRNLRGLLIDTAGAPAVGAKLTDRDAGAGEIVSAAYSPGLGKTVAMAYLRTPSAEAGQTLQVDGAVATVR
jgi:folate-binding protein YgfZ